MIDKIYDGLILMVMLFFIPIILFGIRQDQEIYDLLTDKTNKFIDNVCETGIISAKEYMDLMNTLDATGIVYDIYLIHSEEKITPRLKDNGTIDVNKTADYYEDYFNEEIFNELFPDVPTATMPRYYLNHGDYISIMIKNKTPTYGSRFISIVNPIAAERKLLINASGLIGNEYEDK